MTVELPEHATAKLADLQFACDASLDNSRAANNRLQTFGSQLSEPTRDRFLARRDEQNRRHQDLNLLVTRIKKWVATVPPSKALEPFAVEAKPRDGETVADAITRVRADIAKAQLELISSKNAPPPKAELKAAARECVARLGRAAAPWLDARGEKLINFGAPHDPHTWVERDQVFALLCWWDPDHAIARLEALIDALPDPKNAMTVAEKAKAVGELAAKIERLERDEEALIEIAVAQGIDVQRRPNASPAAVLGLRIVERLISVEEEDFEVGDGEEDEGIEEGEVEMTAADDEAA